MSADESACVYAPFLDCTGPTRLYAHGWKCERHAPPAPPTPDPTRTMSALVAAAAERRAQQLAEPWHLDLTDGEHE